MVIETQVHCPALRADVPRAVVADGDVMDEASPEIEFGDEIIASGNGNAVVAHPCSFSRVRKRKTNHQSPYLTP